LRRTGAKKTPQYRIVVADARAPRDGRFLEVIGHYNPRTQPETVVVDEGRVFHWLSVGAQPSDSVKQLFSKRGTLERFERLRKGEALEALVAESDAANAVAKQINPQTRRAVGAAGSKKKAAAESSEA
jgi:small subunit ribosomal protein S16